MKRNGNYVNIAIMPSFSGKGREDQNDKDDNDDVESIRLLWSRLCADFYSDSAVDETTRIVMNRYASRRVPKEETDDIRRVLSALGFQIVADTYTLSDRTVGMFEEIKNRTRKQYHEKASAERAARFEATLERLSDGAPPSFDSREVREFSTWCKTLSTAATMPFLLGLRNVLSRQLDEPRSSMAWTISNAVFTESGISPFPDRAARLLIRTLGFTSSKDSTRDVDGRRWILSPSLTDTQIQRFLRFLPSSRGFRPSGRVDVSDVSRRADAADTPPCCYCCIPPFLP